MTDPKESKDSSAEKFCHKTEIEIPFENERYARIVCNCLMVDFKHEPPRIAVSIKKNIDQIDGKLSVKLETSSLKSLLSLIFYYLWAFIPSEILIAAGITYFPSKYWAICIPIYSLSFIIIFAIFLYPAINMILTPSLDSVTTIYDRRYRKNDLKSWSKGIPAISDLPLDFVCRHLYLREDCDE
ncbi:phosphatidylinositol N-acetylglucosaminyltransferase subunit P-like protein [Sarcoptes scabiei]|uniref:Phosphatidylinositol N-acetylglucosaminyltransferase subunit P-like protein n=1 Tax=Sarcoptes scabiei TaxID=52283 RepID=A0A132AE75_SARSC|nr:phosphatidylinositol N-acetylglucosaminyltransferase subunit P-like protein [Sarcoptes scabiei]